MEKTILITGATGFIGKKLAESLFEDGYKVMVMARNPDLALETLPFAFKAIKTDISSEELATSISGICGIVNLAGAPINEKRWTDDYKREIVASRVGITSKIKNAIELAAIRPKVFCSTSATGIYGDRGEEVLLESSAPGKDFLADTCRQWENSAFGAQEMTRLVILRFGFVLGKNGGGLAKLLPVFRSGIGGQIGNGEQWMPWVHVDDVVGIIKFALQNDSVEGIYNCVAPNPVKNKDFTISLGKAVHRPAFFKIPQTALSVLMGESSVVATSSARVLPEKIISAGYKFKFPDINSAFQDVTS